MARRVTPSQHNALVRQHNAKVRQHNSKVKQAVDKANRENRAAVNKHNTDVRRHNSEVRKQRQAHKNAVNQYIRAVNTHNAKIRSNRAKINQQISSLQSSNSTRYPEVRSATIDLLQRFERVADERHGSEQHEALVRLAEVESSNSADVAESLLADVPADDIEVVEDTGILEYLSDLSDDLLDRWRGAIYSLSPNNPDAGRHFCTSAREIFTEILEKWASDKEVKEASPECQMTPNGSKPTRRSKIHYLLKLKGADTPEMIGFVDADIENVIRLFDDFNEGTHGQAGKFGFSRLQAIRKRVEGGIMFLAAIAT
jgi:hypothetical protein